MFLVSSGVSAEIEQNKSYSREGSDWNAVVHFIHP
jgi:hypothetical protein